MYCRVRPIVHIGASCGRTQDVSNQRRTRGACAHRGGKETLYSVIRAATWTDRSTRWNILVISGPPVADQLTTLTPRFRTAGRVVFSAIRAATGAGRSTFSHLVISQGG